MSELEIGSPEALDSRVSTFLDPLSGLDAMADFYLAGSAALTLYLGHRTVRSLDLMGYNRLDSPDRRDLLRSLLELDGEIRVETARDGFLHLRMPSGLGGGSVRFFYYPYPLIDPENEHRGIAVASAVDLGLMKLGAITSRGSRRDFVDLYLLCRRLPLDVLLDRAVDKFGHVRDFPLQALKGLSETRMAMEEPMPTLDLDLEWDEVRRWLDGPVRDLARSRVGLA